MRWKKRFKAKETQKCVPFHESEIIQNVQVKLIQFRIENSKEVQANKSVR